MVTIDYDPKSKLFLYPAEGLKAVSGSSYVRTPRGMYYIFSDTYPKNLIALKDFLYNNKGIGASARAAARIEEIKLVKEKLQECSTVEKYESLFTRTPYLHQRTAIEYIMQYERLMLLLEQGLGKTFVSYMAIKLFKEQGIPHRSLVICPRIVLQNWLREIREYTDLNVFEYFGNPVEREACRERIRNADWDVVITTFDMLIDRPETSKHTLETAWLSISLLEKQKYAYKWVTNDMVSKDDVRTLLIETPNKTQKSAMGKILKGIDQRFMPLKALVDAKREARSSTFLKELKADCLFVDEASRCLNIRSNRSNMVESLASIAKRTYLLSGTLCVGRPTDLYMPARIIDGGIFNMDWNSFKKTYCTVAPWNKNIITGYKNVEDIKLRTDPYILSMDREKCLDMPERVFVERYYELDDQQIDVYDEIVEDDYVLFNGGIGASTEMVLQKINKLNQCVSGFLLLEDRKMSECGRCDHMMECIDARIRPWHVRCKVPGEKLPKRPIVEFENNKLDLLADDLEELVKLQGKKVIIWAWYIHDQEAIADFLKDNGYKYVTASDKDCDKRFNEDKTVNVFLGQTRQGIGITLNAATTTIYYSHGPDLEARLQSMDRNYRIGQRNMVTVYDYVCPGTIEENMLALLKHKQDVKAFMQTKVGCLYCPKFKGCDTANVQDTKDCEFKKQLKNASKKKTLGFKKLREDTTEPELRDNIGTDNKELDDDYMEDFYDA